MIRTFLTYYSDEDVAKMLAHAEKNPFTKELASNLQMSLLNAWVRELKSPAEVTKLLDGGTSNALMETYTRKFEWAMKSSGDKLFDRQDLAVWLKYVDFYKARHPGTETSTITILTDRYGGEAVSKVIAASLSNSSTMAITKDLESAQLKRWLANSKSSGDVFKLLKLDQAGKVISLPAMLEVLSKHYDDAELAKMLVLLRKWMAAKTEPNDVYKWLGIKGMAADNPERLVYQKYVKDFHS
ncbi:RxLR effector family protein, partial [Phytophthora palmivora]